MGSWKSLIEMEKSLTMEELFALHSGLYRTEFRHNKFAAALQGVDLEDEQEESAFDRIQIKAAAELAGKTEEEFVFEGIGIAMDNDDDDEF